MALQKINWTQIDTINVPSGYTVQIGKIEGPIESIYSEYIYLSGVSISDLYLNGGSFSQGVLTLTSNSGNTITIGGFEYDFDRYTTGFTYNNANTFTIVDRSGYTLTASFNIVTGLTVNGDLEVSGNTVLNNLSANTINGGTFYGDGGNLNNIVTSINFGNGLSGNTTTGNLTIVNTEPDKTVTITGGTNIQVTGTYPNFGVNFTGQTNFPYLSITGGTVNGDITTSNIFASGLTVNTISATTYQNLPVSFDRFITGFTYSSNTFTISDNSGVTFSSTINELNGLTSLTINGPLSATTISGGTLYGDGSNLTNIDNIYTVDGVLQSNRTIDLSGKTLSLKRSSNLNDPFLTFLDSSGNTMFEIRSQYMSSDLGDPYNRNIFIGKDSGMLNTTASRNVSLGGFALTGITTGQQNTAIGFQAGRDHVDGLWNTFIGSYAGKSWISGNDNTVVGQNNSNTRISGTENTFIGNEVNNGNGSEIITGGTGNVVVGAYSARRMQGDNNVIIGRRSGVSLTTGSGNIFIGRSAGNFETTASNLLYIENTNSVTPLIWGDFANDLLRFNGKVGVNVQPNIFQFDVNGTSRFSNTVQLDLVNSGITDTKILTLSSGNTVQYRDVSEILSSVTADTYVNGFTYSSNTLTILDNSGNTFNVTINEFSGLTINGNLSATTISFDSLSGGTIYNVGSNKQVIFNNNGILSGSSGFTFDGTNVGIGVDSPTNLLHITGSTDPVRIQGLQPSTGNTVVIVESDGVLKYGDIQKLTGDKWISGGSFDNRYNILYLRYNTGGGFRVWLNMTGVTGTTGVGFDTFVTGGTLSSGVATFTNNSGGTFQVSGFTKYFITGSSPSGQVLTIGDRWYNTSNGIEYVWIDDGTSLQWVQPGNFSGGGSGILIGDYLPLSGGTVTGPTNFTNGLNANIISATTYLNLPTFLTGNYLPLSGGTVTGDVTIQSGLTANIISATTYLNLPIDIYTTGFTFNPSNYDLTIERNGGLLPLTQNLSILASDLRVTGGTYDVNTGTATFTNNSGGTFQVSGFLTGYTDTVITGFTYLDNTFTINDSAGSTFTATINNVTGLTVNGILSATTYLNLPIDPDTYITGFTYNDNNTFYIYDNSGNTFNATINTVTGLTVNGIISATTISGGTLYGDGSNLTNVQNIYNSDGTLTGRRTVNMNGNVLTFTGSQISTKIFPTGNVKIGGDDTDTGARLSVSGTSVSSTTIIEARSGIGRTRMFWGTYSNTLPQQRNEIEYSGSTGFPNGLNVTYEGYNIPTGTTSGIVNWNFYSTNPNTPVTQRPLFTINNGPGVAIFNTPAFKIYSNGNIGINQYSDSGYKFDVAGSGRFTSTLQLDTVNLNSTDTKILTLSPSNVVQYRNFSDFGGLTGDYLPLSGGTVTGPTNFTNGLTANTISGGTFFGNGNGLTNVVLSISATTGLSGSSTTGNITLINTAPDQIVTISGGTNIQIDGSYPNFVVNFTGQTEFPYLPLSGGTVTGDTIFQNGLTATTISATTYLNLPIDPDTYVTGFTYNDNNTFYIYDNSGSTFTATINNVTGLTVNGILTINPATGQTYSVINFSGDTFIHNYGVGNTFVGTSAGSLNGTGSDNTGFGEFVLNNLDNGDDNTGIGALVLTDLTGGTFNTALGAGSLQNLISGDNNTGVGVGSNAQLLSGSGNTSIGFQTLFNNTDGSGNVAIGNKAGFNGTGSNKLYIANNDSTTLIYGEFDNQRVGINTTSPTNMFHVAGSTDPVRFEGLQLSSDTRVITTDINGVLHYINVNSITSNYLPLSGGTVTGPTTFNSGLTATIISATTYQNLPVDPNTFITGFTYSNNTFTLRDNSGSTFNATINQVTGFTVNGVLTVTGNTFVQNMTGRTAVFSSSGENVVTVIGSGSCTTSPIFSVIGSQGELFSVCDSLNGSLFSVNDISGLPTLEVFSDDTILMGSYLAPSLNTTKKVTLSVGTNTIYSIPTSAYTGGFFEYTLLGPLGARAGSIMSIWSGTTAQFTEVTTNDIGSTTGVTFSVGVSGNNAVLSSSATTSGWTLKTIIRSI